MLRVIQYLAKSLKIIDNSTIRQLRFGFLFAFHGKKVTSCGERGLKKEAVICVNVCPCHTIFVSYDDW